MKKYIITAIGTALMVGGTLVQQISTINNEIYCRLCINSIGMLLGAIISFCLLIFFSTNKIVKIIAMLFIVISMVSMIQALKWVAKNCHLLF